MLHLEALMIALTAIAAVGSGMMAGLFFAFSNFVMKALSSLTPDKGITAMQTINKTIFNPLFLLVFFGTTLASLGAILFGVLRWREPGMTCLLAGGAAYVTGVFLVTIFGNVPRNNSLAALDPASPGSVGAWRAYVSGWTAWNHVRTIGALAATILLMIALGQLT